MSSLGNGAYAKYGLATLRVVTGLAFFMHGWQKFFDNGIAGVAGFFGSVGIPLPGLAAPLVSTVELVGGAMLILGVFATWAAIPLALDMLVAMLVVHVSNGFFASAGGVELVLLLLAACVTIALTGGGRPSIDGMLADRSRSAGAGMSQATPRTAVPAGD
jgi:putative oxidoreductase